MFTWINVLFLCVYCAWNKDLNLHIFIAEFTLSRHENLIWQCQWRCRIHLKIFKLTKMSMKVRSVSFACAWINCNFLILFVSALCLMNIYLLCCCIESEWWCKKIGRNFIAFFWFLQFSLLFCHKDSIFFNVMRIKNCAYYSPWLNVCWHPMIAW